MKSNKDQNLWLFIYSLKTKKPLKKLNKGQVLALLLLMIQLFNFLTVHYLSEELE